MKLVKEDSKLDDNNWINDSNTFTVFQCTYLEDSSISSSGSKYAINFTRRFHFVIKLILFIIFHNWWKSGQV